MSANPDYITRGDGQTPLITDKLLAELFSETIDSLMESAAEVGEGWLERDEWLSLIKLDISKLPNRLPVGHGGPVERFEEWLRRHEFEVFRTELGNVIISNSKGEK